MSMRTIKFRAWDEGAYIRGGGFLSPERVDRIWDALKNHPKITLQQFTGLLDHSGKEVYDSDRLRQPKPYHLEMQHWDDTVYTVEWCDKSARFELRITMNDGSSGLTVACEDAFVHSLEIIGHIHGGREDG